MVTLEDNVMVGGNEVHQCFQLYEMITYNWTMHNILSLNFNT